MPELVRLYVIQSVTRSMPPNWEGVILGLNEIGGTENDPQEPVFGASELKRNPIMPRNQEEFGAYIMDEISRGLESVGAEVITGSLGPKGGTIHARKRRPSTAYLINVRLTKEEYATMGPLTIGDVFQNTFKLITKEEME